MYGIREASQRLAAAAVAAVKSSPLGPGEAAAFLFALATIVVAACWMQPAGYGDAGEYMLMAQSLFDHGTPDVRPEDLSSTIELAVRYPSIGWGGNPLRTYTVTEDLQWHALHFWGYPLATLPVKSVLHLLRLDEFKAFQITNALLLTAAIGHVLFFSSFSAGQRRVFAGLLLLSPALGFVRWIHPEIFSWAFVTMSLTFLHGQPRDREALASRGQAIAIAEGRPNSLRASRKMAAAALCAAIASVQNAPLVFFTLMLWLLSTLDLRARWDAGPVLTLRGRWPELRIASIAALPTVIPFFFYYWHYGVPSLQVKHNTSPENLSVRTALDLFFDLNIGMLPYVPAALLGTLGLLALCLARPRRFRFVLVLAGLVFLMALATTVTHTWNHGTSGPSRYTIWLMPFVFYLFVVVGESEVVSPRKYRALAALALGTQAFVTIARGMVGTPDFLHHSCAARFVLDRWPSLYNPHHEIFWVRTTHHTTPSPGPFIYKADGECRKALGKKKHHQALLKSCGQMPVEAEGFFVDPAVDEKKWFYVNY